MQRLHRSDADHTRRPMHVPRVSGATNQPPVHLDTFPPHAFFCQGENRSVMRALPDGKNDTFAGQCGDRRRLRRLSIRSPRPLGERI